jgi:KipI family sensor histidine kinase inhibitor
VSVSSEAPATAPAFAIECLGEDVLLLRVHAPDDLQANLQVHALAAAIDAMRPAWLLELVPAYATLALQVDTAALVAGPHADPLQSARAWLQTHAFRSAAQQRAGSAATLDIPVCYGGAHGPDLDALAVHAGLAADDVVQRHAGAFYRVAMLGFAPGFPYLLGLDAALSMPRLDTPRTRVPAGSVGIGGAQTGIYPREGPGGWRLIGRTPLALFDPARDPPSLLQPGQAVRFVPIAAAHFERLVATAKRRRSP